MLPAIEDCGTPGDEDCDGYSCGDVGWSGSSPVGGGLAVARDAAGNSYVVGSVSGDLVLPGQPILPGNAADVFIVKLDSSGVIQWVKRFGDSGINRATRIVTDGSRVYVLTREPIDFGFGLSTGVTLGAFDAASGAPAWSRSCNVAFSNDEAFGGLALSPSGEVLLGIGASGAATVTCDAGGNPQVPNVFPGGTMMMVRYGADGSLHWTRAVGGGGLGQVEGVAFDSAGSMWVAGTIDAPANWGCGQLTPMSGDPYLVKLSGAGACLLSLRWGDSGYQSAFALDVDSEGNPLIGVYGLGKMDFGGGGLSAPSSGGSWLVKLSANLTHKWSKVFAVSLPGPLAVSDSGIVVWGGFAPPGTDFGGGAIAQGQFLVALEASGAHRWTKSTGVSPRGLAANDRVSVVGEGMGTLGSAVITGPGAFWASIDP